MKSRFTNNQRMIAGLFPYVTALIQGMYKNWVKNNREYLKNKKKTVFLYLTFIHKHPVLTPSKKSTFLKVFYNYYILFKDTFFSTLF